jgi:hypothetical protein
MPRLRRLFLFFVLSTCVVAPATGVAQVQADTLSPPVRTDTSAARVDSSTTRAPLVDTLLAPALVDTAPIRDTVTLEPRESSQVLSGDTAQALVRDTAQATRDTVGAAPIVPLDTAIELAVKSSLSQMVTRDPPPKARLVPDGALPELILPYRVEQVRLDELEHGLSRTPMMLRSVSAILSREADRSRWFGIFVPEVQLIRNSALPWSNNDGDLWAGKGSNVHAAAGFFARYRRFQLVVAPEVSSEPNEFFQLVEPGIERFPIPSDRSHWALPWYVNGPYSVDMPTRFGARPIKRLSPGQSSLTMRAGALEAGVSSENNWWGPGIGNALVLSNNAPGFPHYFLRSARPLATRIGDIDFRWIVGGLEESAYFDTTSTNDLRSFSGIAATLTTRWHRGLTFGVARSVYATTDSWGQAAGRFFDVFANTGRPANRPLNDSSLYPGGRDQIFSLFGRLVLPESGVEVYGEWGRTEFPSSFRDLLTAPNHTQAYMFGLQWRRAAFTGNDLWRLQAENTSVEQSPTFRDRPLGVWYTSRRVIQGYTNRGQPLGAAVGPGSSGQNVAVDYMRPLWSVGLKAGRIRYNEDVRSISPIFLFKKWCTHDIYLYSGARSTIQLPFGFAALDYTLGNRIQPWFQSRTGCPRGDGMVDIRNNTLSLTFVPFRTP